MVPKQVEVITSQNVTINYTLATYIERFLAKVIDSFIVLMIFFVFIYASTFFKVIFGQLYDMFLWTCPYILTVCYFALWEVMNKGQTPGKKVLGIQVIKLDGTTLKWSEMFVRALCLFPDQLFSLGIAGTVLIQTTPRRQRLGDIAAGTVVVKMNNAWQFSLSDLLAIHTTDNYTPIYPQVRELTESDMLFIKSVIVRAEKNYNLAHEYAIIELSEHLRKRLNIENKMPADRIDFLRTLLKDYVVLTR